MAFGKKDAPAKSGRENQDRQQTQICKSWLLWCFEQEETKGGFLRMTCKMSSKAAGDGGYGNGVYIDVMCRIQPDKDGNMTDIPEDDYSSGWIMVDGQIRAADWISKNGKKSGTKLTIWASTVRKGGDRK